MRDDIQPRRGWWYPPHFARWWYTKPAAWIRKNLTLFGWVFFWWSMLNENWTTNEITYGDEILVSLGWNLQPTASDEIKSANLTSHKRDLIALAISSTNVDLFRISGFSWKNLTLFGWGFFWWSKFNEKSNHKWNHLWWWNPRFSRMKSSACGFRWN